MILLTRLASDLPGARSKDKANYFTGPALRGETRVFEAGVAANFDPHGRNLHLPTGARSAATNSMFSSAVPGSVLRIRDSPIRKAWKPAARKRCISSAVSMPLSLTCRAAAGRWGARSSQSWSLPQTSSGRGYSLRPHRNPDQVQDPSNSSAVCTSQRTSSSKACACEARRRSSRSPRAAAISRMASAR